MESFVGGWPVMTHITTGRASRRCLQPAEHQFRITATERSWLPAVWAAGGCDVLGVILHAIEEHLRVRVGRVDAGLEVEIQHHVGVLAGRLRRTGTQRLPRH